MTTNSKMMGFETPGDKKIPVTVRDWNAMKLAVWRSKIAWEIVEREASGILEHCTHSDGCPGIETETVPCLSDQYQQVSEDKTEIVKMGCSDREKRASALVILNAARQFAHKDVRKVANETYFAPSREYFSEILAELAAAQTEIEVLQSKLDSNKKEPTVAES